MRWPTDLASAASGRLLRQAGNALPLIGELIHLTDLEMIVLPEAAADGRWQAELRTAWD